MLSRTSFVLASSSRWTPRRLTVASLGSPSTISRNLSCSSALLSSRGGDPNKDRRPRRDNGSHFDKSSSGNPISHYSRNQRFAPDGTRKRLPHPNAKPRQSPNQDQKRQDQRSPRRDRDRDDLTLKFGSTSSESVGSSASAAAKRDSTVSKLRARNAADNEDGVDTRGSRSRDSDTFGDAGTGDNDSILPGRSGDVELTKGRNAVEKSDRHHTAKQKKKEGRGSLLDVDAPSDRGPRRTSGHSSASLHGRHTRSSSNSRDDASAGSDLPSDQMSKPRPKLLPKVSRNVFLPSIISVVMLATKMEKKVHAIQNVMTELGMQDTRPDCMLKFQDAEMIAAQLNVVAVPNDEASFDLYPRPIDPNEVSSYPLRPPVVTIMGHVDHGKTTLLDKLRSTSVAQGEAGGITQHIGAFSVPITGREQDKGKQKGYRGVQTITFLDTPGHAAFTAMRSRGAMVTDIVVLVVAADDGVMPQTQEVIDLVKSANREATASADSNTQQAVQMVVALNKIDKTDADPERVKRELLAAGVELEELGGDVPCVEISGKSGVGLEELEETIVTLAELAELRAEDKGLPEGYVIESKVDKGRGNVATVLIKRGVLQAKSPIIAGTAWCKVRQILHSSGRPLSKALPGDPVLISGWRELPTAGDMLIGGPDELSCKKAAENRRKMQEQKRLMEDVEQINEARRIKALQEEAEAKKEFEERQRRRAARLAADDGKDPLAALAAFDAKPVVGEEALEDPKQDDESEDRAVERADGKKFLNVIIKADYSGTVEAVVGAISTIGNAEAGVKIISTSVGEPTEGDVATAAALGGTIIGFNVKPSKSVLQSAARAQPTPVAIIVSDVIYRLMETVSASVSSLLPPSTEARVQGEATISQIFEINLKGKKFKKIAGCRITNGTISKSNMVRVLRGKDRLEVYNGRLDDFKHLKKDVTEMRKGTECGMSFDGWQDLHQGDLVQSYTEVQVPRTL